MIFVVLIALITMGILLVQKIVLSKAFSADPNHSSACGLKRKVFQNDRATFVRYLNEQRYREIELDLSIETRLLKFINILFWLTLAVLLILFVSQVSGFRVAL